MLPGISERVSPFPLALAATRRESGRVSRLISCIPIEFLAQPFIKRSIVWLEVLDESAPERSGDLTVVALLKKWLVGGQSMGPGPNELLHQPGRCRRIAEERLALY